MTKSGFNTHTGNIVIVNLDVISSNTHSQPFSVFGLWPGGCQVKKKSVSFFYLKSFLKSRLFINKMCVLKEDILFNCNFNCIQNEYFNTEN